MSENRFTPGPWNWSHNSASDSSTACIGITPETEGGYRGSVADLQSCEHINGTTMQETEANARLIAAAPDLLAAIQTLVSNGGIGPESMFHDARAAIAKATGDQS